jgi:hypothetical protein
MTLNFSPTTFTSGTTMSSSAVNANFAAMQQQSAWFSGTWVARNNTSVGLTASDYTYSPLSVNVVRLAPPLTSPDRGIVLSVLKAGAASDRLGLDSATGKLLTGFMTSPNFGLYPPCVLMTGIGSGTFNKPSGAANFNNSIMANMGTTATSGGSAVGIGYAASVVSIGTNETSYSTTINIYAGASVPWIAVFTGF